MSVICAELGSVTLPLVRDIRGRRTCIPKGTNVLSPAAGPSALFLPAYDSASSELTPAGFARIKRRSAFLKHVKAKHDIDLNKVPFEEAAIAANLIRVSPDAERVATPPPDYTTATKEPMYKEEDLPTFSSDAMPKEEVHTPPSVVTPPPPVIDVVPSSDGYKWSSVGFVGTFFISKLRRLSYC